VRVLGVTLPPRAPRDSERVRRPADLLFAVMALVVIIVVLGAIETLPLGSGEVADYVSRALRVIPRWLSFGAVVIAAVGSYAFAVVALAVLIRREWRDALNASVAAVAAIAAAVVAWTIWRIENGAVAHAMIEHRNPATFVVDTSFVAFLVGTDLVRRSRWSRWCTGLTAVLLLSGLAVDALTPFSVVLALFGGLMVGWAVRWLLGAPSVRPSTGELIAWLTQHGVKVSQLATDDPETRARLDGVLHDGTAIEVHLADRDTRGAGLARQVWSLIRLRPVVSGHLPLSSRGQLQQVALAALIAQKAGVPGPSVLLLDETPSETLVLVVARPSGNQLNGKLKDQPGAETATALFRSLRALHDAGIAHRDLEPENLYLAGTSAGFSSFDTAVPGASQLVRRLDLAQLLVTLGRAVGPAGAVRGLRDGYGPADEALVAAVMQPIALAPWGWSAMREAQGCLTEVRHELLGPDPNADVPAIRLERFRWRTIISTLALTVAAYLIVGQVSKVNVLGTLGKTNLGLFAVAVVASAITYFAAALNLAAFVPKRLSMVRGFFVQLSSAFIGVAMPPTVGHVAVNARYLHRQQVDESSIAAAVALSQIVNVVTTVLLLISFGLLTGSGLSRFKIAPGGDVLIGLAAMAGVIAIVLAIPRTRAKVIGVVWPHLRGIWPRLLDAFSHPLRLAISGGANLLLTAAYLVAFIAALLSVGAHPPLLPAAVVYLAGNTVGSAAPTPGGLGGVEAVLVAGLTAIGIPADQAIPAVLVFRVATFWLPIPAGGLSYVVLLRRGTL
jgi:glycosyltransferase 2 family protein